MMHAQGEAKPLKSGGPGLGRRWGGGIHGLGPFVGEHFLYFCCLADTLEYGGGCESLQPPRRTFLLGFRPTFIEQRTFHSM